MVELQPIDGDTASRYERTAGLSAMWDASPSGIGVACITAGARPQLTGGNAALARLYGCTVDQLPGRTLDSLLLDPLDTVAVTGGWREHRCRDADGHELWTRWHVAAIADEPTRAAGSVDGDRLMVQIDVIDERVRARRQAQRQSRLLDLIPEPIIVRSVDGTILYWNDGATGVYGYDAAHAVGRRTHDLLQTRFHDVTLPELEARLADTGVWSGTLEHRHADGHWLRMSSKHVRDEPAFDDTVILEVNVDVTDRYEAEQALVASESKFRSQFRSSTVGQIIRRVDGTIEEVNDAFAEMLGYEQNQLVGIAAERLFSPDTAVAGDAAVAALIDGQLEAVTNEGTLMRTDGSELTVELNVSVARAADGSVERIIGIVQDITARKAAQDTLTHRATHDPLTGLVNRGLFVERLTDAMAEGGTTSTIGLLYLDLDGFKEVNDTFGHLAGDTLLVQAGQRLVQCVRAGDTVARLGGDEFVVLCPDLDNRERLHRIARRTLDMMGAPYELGGQRRVDFVTASIGLAYALPGHGADEALNAADRAMYEAKRAGKNRIRPVRA